MNIFINYIRKIIHLANNKKYLFIKYAVLVMIFLNHYSYKADALHILAAAGTAELNAAPDGEDYIFTMATSTMAITDATTVYANSFTTTAGTGTIVGFTTGSLTVEEYITSAANAPLTINMTNVTAATLQEFEIQGYVHESSSSTGAIVFNIGMNSLIISGDSKIIEAEINGDPGSTLTISGDTTFTDTVNVSNISIGTGKKVTFDQSVVGTVGTTVTGSIILNSAATIPTLTIGSGGTATINSNSQNIDNIVLEAGSSLIFGSDSMSSSGALIEGSVGQVNASIDANSTIIFPNTFVGGQTQTLFAETVGSNADLVLQLNTVIKDSVLANYVVTGGESNNTALVTATDKSISEISAQLGTSENDSAALMQSKNSIYASTDTAALTAFNSAIDTNVSARNFADQVSPPTDTISGSNIEVKAVTSQIQNIIAIRTASLRDGQAYTTGVAAGNESSVRSIYLQGFGSSVEQKTVGDIYGYDAETAGFAVGFDTKTYGGVVFGISYANATIDVTGKGTGSSENKIKVSSGSLYSDYTTDFGYVEGSLTYGRSDNSTSRIVSVSDVNRSYAANYNSDSFSFRLFGGIPFNLGVDFYTTPFIGTTISMIKSDSYQEQSSVSNDALALSYADSTVNSQVGTLGFKFQEIFEGESSTTTAELKLAVNQEFGDDKITNTNTYQGGGTSFENTVDIAKTSGTVGLGLDFIYDAIAFSIGYEANIRDQYLGHSAQAKFTAKF
jgi:uncharacterized protein with beta-barrel porin domain